jgi:hypothetical protein
MQIAILSAVMVFGLLVLLRLRLVRGSSLDNRKWDRRTGFGAPHPFHAVSIEPTPASCPAAASIKAQRFLSEEAPSLPLMKCDASKCECRYVHHADRRSGALDRRLGPVEESDESEFWSMRNRRSFLGRRLTEKQTA